MKVIFRAQKMIERVTKEGKAHLLDKETIDFINMLDGKEAETYNWQSQVEGAPIAWIPADEDQAGTSVNINDCE